jgi:hypothetical protein
MSWYLYFAPAIPYVFLVLFLVLLMIAAYIKIKYRFWTLQPVYHVYDFHYFFYRYGIIMNELPEKNKYCNFYQIKTLEFSKVKYNASFYCICKRKQNDSFVTIR